jgi:hypothetical protein
VFESVLEAVIRLAARCEQQQSCILSMMLPDVVNFMQAVACSCDSPPGYAMGPAAAGSENWKPSLLLTCLKASKLLDDKSAQHLMALEDATRTASHARAAAAAQAGSRSNTATAEHDRSQLLLLAGRALYVAASALLQLHEGPDVTAQPAGAWKLPAGAVEDPALVSNAPLTIEGLGLYVTATGHLLPGATSALAGHSSTPAHVAELQ